MADRKTPRNWATPLTMGAFVLMAATGILMFFRFEPGFTRVVHQCFSWFFLIGATGHIVANFRPLQRHLKTIWGRSSIALFVALFAASLSNWGMMSPGQLEQPIKIALLDAPLSTLADLTRTKPIDLIVRLKANGIRATADQSIRIVASASGASEGHLMGLIFIGDGPMGPDRRAQQPHR